MTRTAPFLCCFEKTIFDVSHEARRLYCLKLGEGNTLLDRRRPMERNQIRFLLFVVNPHYEEDPAPTGELNLFTHLRNVHQSPWQYRM